MQFSEHIKSIYSEKPLTMQEKLEKYILSCPSEDQITAVTVDAALALWFRFLCFLA